MTEDDAPDELKPWLGRCQDRIREMLSTDAPNDPQQRHKELLAMATQFLSLAQKFLNLANTARKAAQSMEVIKDANSEKSAGSLE
jgi:hypothetical protein